MNFCYQLAILILFFTSCKAAHNCTSFDDKNHGFGCELRNVTQNQENLEISVMAKDNTNKTETDVVWVQIRDSQFDGKLPKGAFEKFNNMEKIMIINSIGFQTLADPYFDKKISLILMKNTDLETITENALEGLEKLKILSLNYNRLVNVHKRAFRDLVSLEKVEMVNNKLESLDDNTFSNNVNLKQVLLYNNQLKVISTQLFSRNINLESLQLQNNLISQVEKGFHLTLTKLTRADFSSNVCISETILLTRYVQWSSHQYKFKDCYNNYALMKSTNGVIKNVQEKVENLETKVADTLERVNNDMMILEVKMGNSTELANLKTDLVKFFETDKDNLKQQFDKELKNITSQVRSEMEDKIKENVEEVLMKTQEAKQEKLVSNDFEDFRDEFSSKFTLIYVSLFIMFCAVCATAFLGLWKLKIFPKANYQSDNRHLIDSEAC